MDIYSELVQARKRVQALEEEIDRQEQEKTKNLLNKNKEGKETFLSSKGTIWYKFPANPFRKTVGYGRDWFLTDLQGNYIADKHTYEGRPCAPAWAVGAFYCATEQQAIDCFEGR